ncbi:LysR family transcriptional regulator [Spirochaeta cellobiosiphila]|uniref:LysR family transcriptional regulator n=1 Tax=Spirochaeta cellobiosiphila TaxID=504483 RepID=UPI00041DCF58|nr:LysR family transcriptional regulator [Spirochaeta cellobiosiphila]
MLDYRIVTFLTVVEQGTLHKASIELGLTQPAVSQHIKAIEELYGVTLFNHQGRKLVLNDAGKLLHEYALKGQVLFDRYKHDLKSLKYGHKSYRMGATLTIGEYILPHYLGLYRKEFPSLDLTIQIDNTINILEKLDRREIDLAIVEGPYSQEKYQSRLFLKDEMVFISSTQISLPQSVNKAFLSSAKLILREKGSGTRYYWDSYCKRNNIDLGASQGVMEIASLGAIKSLVAAGLGYSIMSTRAVEQELDNNSIISIPFAFGPLYRNMYFVWTSECPLEFINEFVDFCEANK